MTSPYNPNKEEREAIKKLQIRFENNLAPELEEDATIFYRFLKARDFDVDKAEIMLKKCIAWRKGYQVDNMLDTFEPKEVFLKYTGVSLIGPDKEGNSVRYTPTGNIDMRDLTASLKMNDFMKHCICLAEQDIQRMKLEHIQNGRNAYQTLYIFDLDNLTLANTICKSAKDLFTRILHLLQDTYPERLKTLYVINAPSYYVLLFAILKRGMSNALARKIQVFGRNGWKEALLEVIDADVLPAFLGGNRTDPDGNPSCKTFMIRGGKVPKKYFLSSEERRFKDMSQVKKVFVPPNTNHKIPVEVDECGSIVRWAFESKGRDIGFGLFHQKSEQQLEELLPILRYMTNDGTETGSFTTRSAGTYFIVFDNSYSWINSKEVSYTVTVDKPVSL